MNLSGNSFLRREQTLLKEKKSIIGVIGGSGLCKLPGLVISDQVKMETKYGNPSELISIGELNGAQIAFVPRHGFEHTIPPHKIPYKANLMALKSLGVQHVIGTCVVGSLRQEIEPGTFVTPDQFINFTWGRDDTFDLDGRLVHLSMARPYCEHLQHIIAREITLMNIRCCDKGAVVVIQGPRFSTIAESKMYALLGGDIINMTQYPECYFARELGLCYGTVATVTDYDVSVPSSIAMQPSSMETVLTIFRSNTEKTVILLEHLAGVIEEIRSCRCASGAIDEYYKLAKIESE